MRGPKPHRRARVRAEPAPQSREMVNRALPRMVAKLLLRVPAQRTDMRRERIGSHGFEEISQRRRIRSNFR